MRKKILFLSTRDSVGGASEWFFNLANTLAKANYEIMFAVTIQNRTEAFILKIPSIIKRKSYIQRGINFGKRKIGINKNILKTLPEYAFFPGEEEFISHVSAEHIYSKLPSVPDIIITGLTYGFVNTSVLLQLQKLTNASVYQTAFDVNVFTGGCHVFWNCEGYKSDCLNCPGISNKKTSYASNNLAIKKRNIKDGDFGVLLAGAWSMHNALSSIIYKNQRKVDVGLCINTELFTNKNRDIAKRLFDLPSDCKVIFAGSDNVKDTRKGRAYLVEALSILWNQYSATERENVYILLAGNNNGEDSLTAQIQFKKHLISFISDYRLLSLAYQASDIFVCPSVEDAGPMMIGEALACGTPVVGFEMGLLYDDSIVKSGINGYRVKLKDSNDLAKGLNSVLQLSGSNFQAMSIQARESAHILLSDKHFVDVISNL